MKTKLLMVMALVCACSIPAFAWTNRIQFLEFSLGSELSPNHGIEVLTDLTIEDPMQVNLIVNKTGSIVVEILNGYYGLLALDNNGSDWVVGVDYINPAAWPEPVDTYSMGFRGWGKSYLGLYPDSKFRFNQLNLNEDGSINSCEVLVFQHGVGWEPYYHDASELLLFDYNQPETSDAPVSLMSLVVIPEPTSVSLFLIIGSSALVLRRRNRR